MSSRPRWYVGFADGKWNLFNFNTIPTYATHGSRYICVVGPFRTKRGAKWASEHQNFESVYNAEREAKELVRGTNNRL
jgi:hypothetical protein